MEKYCKDYTQIEHYEEALKSPLKYDLHHRREISENKSKKQLIDENLYYGRPPEELIFLEHREHVRLHKAGKHLSAESRQKMSNAKKGEKCYMYGKPKSAETKQKMSDAKKGDKNPMFGKNMSAETRKRMSDAHKGRLASEDTRKKMSNAKKGKPSPNRGKAGTCLGKHWHLENGKHVYTN